MTWFDGFDARLHDIGGGRRIHARTGGSGPPLLLLHGFPQTHAMWHRVAKALADRFLLVLPDLPGYGDSPAPEDAPEHAQMSKRALASELVALMRALGHERYAVAAHDRGARVAHRLALDHPDAVERLALIDIVPTLDMYERADARLGTLYHHWFHLIQPAPLPERMIGGDPLFYLRWTLGAFGSRGTGYIEPQALADYERCFTPASIHAMCEDYRAAAGIDLAHDRESRGAGATIACPVLLLWGERGVVHRLFNPVALWQARCARPVQGCALPAGHFVPEECPDEVARRLREFLARTD